MKPEFKQLLQIGIIVRDVNKAVRYYEEVLGMGPWEVSYMRGDQPPTEDSCAEPHQHVKRDADRRQTGNGDCKQAGVSPRLWHGI